MVNPRYEASPLAIVERVTSSPVVLVPAHNESDQIEETIISLMLQTHPPQKIIVIADNCSDDTEALALKAGAEVFVTKGNTHKKAGGLNQWLDLNLSKMSKDSLVMVMDADSALEEHFLENAMRYINAGYSACGGVFQGKDGGSFIGTLQRNEYARYARDIERKNGKTLVLTGTATVFTAACLQDVVKNRIRGRLPNCSSDKNTASVYDTAVLTEDNELTYALLHLGHEIIAPIDCMLKTEVMSTWTDLWNQRLRWKRGAIENNVQYGLNRVTMKYWFLQIWGAIGILATMIYLATLIFSVSTGTLQIPMLWLLVSLVFVMERVITVKSRGWKQMLMAGTLIVEMPFDLFLQATHVKAFFDAFRRTKSSW